MGLDGRFRRGHDPRRHELTTAERRRGGLTTWRRWSRCWRQSLGLPQIYGPQLEKGKGDYRDDK